MKVERLGERALLIRDLPCEPYVAARLIHASMAGMAGLEEATSSYETVGLFYSAPVLDLEQAVSQIGRLLEQTPKGIIEGPIREIPVCYEMGEDLDDVADRLGIATEEVIRLHVSLEYRCYAIGFSPGFAYLGHLPQELSGVPRLNSPRVRVEAGSVGITGRQTAVYPASTPGGWNLIGRCPLTLVDVADDYFPLEAGDLVRFLRIDDLEFARLKGVRL